VQTLPDEKRWWGMGILLLYQLGLDEFDELKELFDV